MSAVQTVGISKTFGSGSTEVRALQDANMTLERSSVVALLGPSGSGKSTLIKAMGLIVLPDTGQVYFDDRLVFDRGEVLVDVRDLRREYLGFVFQKSNLVSFLTARENILVTLDIAGHGAPRARADELLDYLDIAARADAYPEELSGGEQQRVSIARALANSPSLILADEPTAALDKDRGRAVMELFRRVAHEQGAAVLVVTHDQRALDVFDRIYNMEDGRLLP